MRNKTFCSVIIQQYKGVDISHNYFLISVQAALALLPAGTTAVAVFPPYAIPRTFPAVTVVFQENNRTAMTVKKSRSKDLDFQSVLRNPRSIWTGVKHYFKCFRSRMSRHMRPLSSVIGLGSIPETKNWPKYNTSSYRQAQSKQNIELENRIQEFVQMTGRFPNIDELNGGQESTLEDCFNDMPKPLYGFRTNVTGTMNVTCLLLEQVLY